MEATITSLRGKVQLVEQQLSSKERALDGEREILQNHLETARQQLVTIRTQSNTEKVNHTLN